ncbi:MULTISPECIES: formate--tetrahydrofolate ligase [unclassified Brachybacterium]|uniref:formate--tetrahydrofolate ligase n=1 Tax=unclassified Brachybacterium TaxID=2623841 RepID=UPI000C8022B6|nr:MULTISPECIES: formate--tetrahydrofolate ligase [unclassified Brachybacterium]PMC76784.1 formate--tetrahydrofolate ligase [Brachybacterium sp. UMB0905]
MSTENPDLAIAQQATLRPITEIAEKAGVPEEALVPYGTTKAKVDVRKMTPSSEQGKLVLVSAMSPTPAGEGKSTTTVGLADAFSLKGMKTMVALREPALGPVMGIKGGATGGGHAQVVPMEDINLHFTGDFHAIQIANNTLAALVDNHIHQGNELNIDARRIQWKRVVDVNDRALRKAVIGLGGPAQGVPREDGFDIVVASEIMAILCLATDLEDLQARIDRIVVGFTYDRKPVTVEDLQVGGAITMLLKDALLPNLVQTLGGTPALVHGGPFANIAHGCNSLAATRLALSLSEITVTEAGFGSDLGAEKFFDIKSRLGDLRPDAAVVVATVRALKMHGGVAKDDLATENIDAAIQGTDNLRRHVENVRKFGLEPVIALNRFPSDTEAEIDAVLGWAKENGFRAALSEVWAKGGEGGLAVAEQVLAVIEEGTADFHQLYDPEIGVEEALRTLAKEVYGADDVVFEDRAPMQLRMLKRNGWDKLPVCVAKTQYSFSDDPKALGAPTGHVLHVRDLVPKIGAGFVVALTGAIMTMPGLPKQPAALRMGVTESGDSVGLF